jgi:hypothetical protein
MSRNTKIVVAAASVLALTVTVLAWLNRGNVEEKRHFQDNGIFLVNAGGEQYTVSMDDIMKLGPRFIDANYKPSGRDPVQRQFTGISLKSLFDYLDVDYSSARSVSFTAADGYASAISIADALDELNCCIVFEEGGTALGTRESGGSGPYMMILAKDQFSQRWCKYLLELTVN